MDELWQHCLFRADSLYNISGIVIAVISLPFLLGRRRHDGMETGLMIVSAVWLAIMGFINIRYDFPIWDFDAFYKAGTAMNSGGDPYAIPPPIPLNPLPAMPLFRLFAVTDQNISGYVWTAMNVALLLALPFLAWRSLSPQPAINGAPVEPFPRAVAAAVFCSFSSLNVMASGQICALVAAALFAGIGLRMRMPVMAGLFLAIVSLKPGSLIPILTQLLATRFRRIWAGMFAGILILSVAGTNPILWPQRLKSNLNEISKSQDTGEINDYSYLAPYHGNIVSISRLLYCVGFRDKGMIAGIEWIVLLLLLILLARTSHSVYGSWNASYSMACLTSCFFLYHRIYDLILCIPALIYCANAVRSESGWRRWMHGSVVLGLLIVLNSTRFGPLQRLAEWSIHAGAWGRVAQIVILPHAIWILLWCMFAIYVTRRPSGSK